MYIILSLLCILKYFTINCIRKISHQSYFKQNKIYIEQRKDILLGSKRMILLN